MRILEEGNEEATWGKIMFDARLEEPAELEGRDISRVVVLPPRVRE